MALGSERPDCMRCQHFHVTWDEARPRGCRAFGFKTDQNPAAVVRRESGRECHLFEPKRRVKGPRAGRGRGPGRSDGLYG